MQQLFLIPGSLLAAQRRRFRHALLQGGNIVGRKKQAQTMIPHTPGQQAFVGGDHQFPGGAALDRTPLDK